MALTEMLYTDGRGRLLTREEYAVYLHGVVTDCLALRAYTCAAVVIAEIRKIKEENYGA